MSLWLTGIPVFFFVAFLILFRVKRLSLAPSFMLTLSIFSAFGVVTFYLYHSSGELAVWIQVVLLIAFFVVIAFGLYAIIAFLLFNAWIVLRKETRTLAHSLTLLLALGLIGYLIALRFLDSVQLPPAVLIVDIWIQGLVFCYALHATHFIIAVSLCNLSRPRKNQDYLIVHGAGLKGGKVTPLLAGRVDKAIAFYRQQEKLRTPPKLVLSGGQGTDESRPEAEAMAEYAEEQGMPRDRLLLEQESTTTAENMRFSKRLMDEDSGGAPYHAVYVTSNYHVLRTGLYAQKAGLKIMGIGSKTALYYLPTALLREYLAFVTMHWRQNLVFIATSLVLSLAGSLILIQLS